MRKKYGNAGQGARDMAFKREMAVAGILVVMLLLIWVWSANMSSISKLGLPAVIVLTIGFRMVFSELDKKGRHFKKRAKDAERGARAEVKVEEKLTALPDDYISFHDLAFPGFNIDHLAIGTGGVFVIETKSHGGTITSNGSQLLLNTRPPEKDFINQTWSQTYHIKGLLKERLKRDIPVKPILCFTNAFVQVRGTVKGVQVLNGKWLNAFIAKQRQVLTSEQTIEIAACLRMVTKVDEPENI